ncbi:MAG: 1-(5-phosphoribosyl)-5-[(5-phosphoribosylamino)methylideneamino]imidazole-4-carboxamide isomerase [Rickettsiales bacterium]|nr:1-(5-phosphoribosyl)-5-[(5-phosphoribosylamino)methylideneamino]imidazole-4-carboxamide isomerase [Rickettsiales bacterium]
MILFPAIDLKNGKCVRLLKGDFSQTTIYNENPLAQAQEFINNGFKFLHLVDLDGALNGNVYNQNAIKEIIQNIKVPIQLGGGIRTIKDIEKWLNIGVGKVILGTIAVTNPEITKEACKLFKNQIIIGIDSRNNLASTAGWVENSNITTIELAKKYEDVGVSAIIYTDISRDGTLSGLDIEGTKALATAIKVPVIASGGVGTVEDLIKISQLEKSGVCGAIIGKAWYQKTITIKELQENSFL